MTAAELYLRSQVASDLRRSVKDLVGMKRGVEALGLSGTSTMRALMRAIVELDCARSALMEKAEPPPTTTTSPEPTP